MLLPPMTRQLAQRIEQNDNDYSLSRLGGMQQARGNPLQIEIKRYGNVNAFLIKRWPDFWYGNKVLGLEPSSEIYLNQIIDLFTQYNLSFRFEIMPGNLNSSLASRLYKLRFAQMGFNTAIYGLPSLTAKMSHPKQLRVREVQSNEIDLFLDLYQDGFELPRLKNEEKEAVLSWLQRAKSNLYLCIAQIDDKPAAVAILYMENGIGLLADAATLPEFRGRGCHTALIHHRIAQAEEHNCDLLTSFVEFGSTSHLNLERAGLRVAYTKSMWWRVE
ncbi:MAG TPA: GNAT family N-acetyltransferase [Anaerolineales bacterium]|nr:GNAT family N-acetyltransferase [Anaerolineales bacterium]